MKLRLLHDVDSFDNESKSLSEYRREMELLQQEKMAHVEELRQIHADINAMETVIKQVHLLIIKRKIIENNNIAVYFSRRTFRLIRLQDCIDIYFCK